jgi:hypothetical protein
MEMKQLLIKHEFPARRVQWLVFFCLFSNTVLEPYPVSYLDVLFVMCPSFLTSTLFNGITKGTTRCTDIFVTYGRCIKLIAETSEGLLPISCAPLFSYSFVVFIGRCVQYCNLFSCFRLYNIICSKKNYKGTCLYLSSAFVALALKLVKFSFYMIECMFCEDR